MAQGRTRARRARRRQRAGRPHVVAGALDTTIRDVAQATNFAAFTVRLGSGDAMTHVMWVDADDDHVLINTEVHRAKFKAVECDPRVTVTIWVKDDP